MKKVFFCFVFFNMALAVYTQELVVAVDNIFATTSGYSEEELNTITELFAGYLFRTGKVMVLTRNSSQWRSILKEYDFQRKSGLVDPSEIRELGGALGANAVVIGTIGLLGRNYILYMSIYDVVSGAMLSSADETFKDKNDMNEVLPSLARKIVFLFEESDHIAKIGTDPEKEVTLNDAIRGAVQKVQNILPKGETIIVLQFNSPNQNQRLSNHILKILSTELDNLRKFRVLPRTELKENDKSQAILTGSLENLVNYYSFEVKVSGTETVYYTAKIDKNDKDITALEGRKSTSQKLLTGAQNIALGLGSYFEGDTIGGITISAGYVLAIGLIVIDKVALDWDSPMVGVPSTIGVVAAGVTLAYGFVRPFIYNRAPSVAAVLDNAKAGFVMLSDTTGNRNTGFQATYTIKF